MKSRILFAVLGLFFCLGSAAQNMDSRTVIQRGIKYFDQEQLESAAQEFIKVPMTDTNYLWAQYELALTYSRDSTKTEDAIRIIKNAKPLPFNAYELTLRMLEGSIYDELKQTEKAHAVYDDVLKKYPEYQQVYYEKGIVYFLSEDYEKADAYFQQSLVRNPYHFRSHYFLGKSLYMQGRIAESIIATHFGLMATSDKDQAGVVIDQLSLLSQGSDTLINRSKNMHAKFKNPLYDEITEVLISRIAADKNYQLKTKIHGRKNNLK